MSAWEAKCSTCQFYTDDHDFQVSNCLRYPPQVVAVPPVALEQHDACGRFVRNIKYDLLSKFPVIVPDDWCGEYEPHKVKFRNHMQDTL